MKKFIIGLCLSFSLVAKVPKVESTTLANGMKVTVFCLPNSPTVNTYMKYEVGCADDPRSIVGISHMLEHMMFRGTNKYGDGEIAKITGALGSVTNAFTTQDITVYTFSMPAKHLNLVLEIEADRMVNLKMQQKAFDEEHKVVMEERLMRIDSHPIGKSFDLSTRIDFITHPYGIMPIGQPHHINAYTMEAAYDHYKKWYAPNNAELIISGPFSLKDILPAVKSHFESISSRTLPQRVRPAEPEREDTVVVAETENMRIANIAAYYSFFTKSYINDVKKAYTQHILVSALFGNQTRYIPNKLIRQQRLLTSGSVDKQELKDPGVVAISIEVDKSQNIKRAEKALFSELKKVYKNGVNKKDFNDTKQEITNSLFYIVDSPDSLSGLIDNYIFGIPLDGITKIEETVKSITIEDVNTMFREMFSNFPVQVFYVYPHGKLPKKPYDFRNQKKLKASKG